MQFIYRQGLPFNVKAAIYFGKVSLLMTMHIVEQLNENNLCYKNLKGFE